MCLFLRIQGLKTSFTCSTYSFTEAQLNDIQLAITNANNHPSQQLGIQLIQPLTKHDKIALAAVFANFLIVAVTLILISTFYRSYR